MYTGVSSHVVSNLCQEGDPPTGLFLESPFTSIGEEVKHHMLAAIYRYMPGFDYIFVKPLHRNDIAFESDRHIANIDIPMLIFHAIDDPVIPYFLGRKLHSIAKRKRSSSAKPIYFKGFGEGFGHKYIYRSPELPQLIRDFVHCSCVNQWPCPGFNKSDSADVLVQD
ncbi:unnamed protein product [Orchesella dallaii]|uniref:Acylglycerol lipase n=1 Tax=Orchesella dallaii TaxID=48710 RepID=A0ABP1RZP1_9HEXA